MPLPLRPEPVIPPWIPPEEYPGRIAALNEPAEEKGRGGTEFDIANRGLHLTGRDARGGNLLGREDTQRADRGLRPRRRSGAGLIGSADDVGEKIARYVEAGVNHYEMKFIYHTVDRFARATRAIRVGRYAGLPLEGRTHKIRMAM